MIGRPVRLAALLAGGGAAALLLAEPRLPPSRFGPAALGAACVLAVTAALLRELRRRDRLRIAIGCAVIGFMTGAAAATSIHPWPLGFAAAWLPALLLFIGGIGRERLAHELQRLEDEADAPERRPHVIARATAVRDGARAAARELDPEAGERPAHAGDPRAVYAYAAQVAAYALGLDGRWADAAASLGDVPIAWMPAPMRVLMRCNLSHAQACAGDLDAARGALDGLSEDEAPPEVRPFLRGARAAVLVRAGEIEAALDLVGREDGAAREPDAVRQRYRITRAHALAAKGDEGGARAEIRRVVEDAGVGELRRWAPAGGPALPLIQAAIDAG